MSDRKRAIETLDCISRERLKQIVFNITAEYDTETIHIDRLIDEIDNLPTVTPQEPKTGYCKDCKFFELNSWAACGGIPIIVAHEICKAWGEGCKTKIDGYCFLFEPKESEG